VHLSTHTVRMRITHVNSAFHPSGLGKSTTMGCMAGVWRGTFTCVGWQVTLCDAIRQVTSRSSEMWFSPGRELYIGL